MATRHLWLLLALPLLGCDPGEPLAQPEGEDQDAATAEAILDAGASLDAEAQPDPSADARLQPTDGGPGLDAELGRHPITVRGAVSFDDRLFDPGGFTGALRIQAAAQLRVELREAQTDTLLAWGRTDDHGRYQLSAPGRATDRWVVEAQAEVQIGPLTAEVRDRARRGARYALRSPPFPAQGDPQVDLHAPASAPIGGAVHTAHTLGEGLALLAPWASRPARVAVRWEAGAPWPCGSCYARDQIYLGGGLEDPDEYDDAIILHELAHWFVEHFSADDSPGGPHRDRQVSPTLAYGEGLAYFLAALVRDDPHLVDCFFDSARHIDLETVTQQGEALSDLRGTHDGRPTGALREELVAGIMWDAHDPYDPAEPFDTLEIGAAGHLALLTEDFGGRLAPDVGAPGIDLADWLEALACRFGAAPVQPLIDDRAFPWDVGTGGCARKQQVPTPFRLVARGATVWLVPEPGATLPALRRWALTKTAPTPLRCAGPCPVGPAGPDDAWIVTAPGAPWAGAAWVGPKQAARLAGGTLRGARRSYPSAPRAPR